MNKILEYMLDEDEGFGDVTSNSVIGENEEVRAYIVSKDEGILAGINIAKELFGSKRVKVLFHLSDGNKIKKGEYSEDKMPNSYVKKSLESTECIESKTKNANISIFISYILGFILMLFNVVYLNLIIHNLRFYIIYFVLSLILSLIIFSMSRKSINF